MALAVVTQLRALAAVVENRPFIVRDHGCLPGLVSFLRDDDEQVVFTALETLNFLAQLESNCTPVRPCSFISLSSLLCSLCSPPFLIMPRVCSLSLFFSLVYR